MLLEIEGLDQHYGSAQVLRGVSLAVADGTCTAVLGRNGAGKTTLLRCLLGLIPASGGRIRFDGADIAGWPPSRRARAGIGYVPQGREIFADLSVAENLAVPLRGHGIADRTGVDEVCATFPVLRTMWRRRGGDLSGGQQQQLAIARALLGRPRLLVLDEPTEGIQPNIVQAIEAVIAGLRGRMAILLVEQYLDFACGLADRYAVMQRGAVVAAGSDAAADRPAIQGFISI